jgi:hypothetical protein
MFNVAIRLRKLLLSLHIGQSTSHLFVKIEKEADPISPSSAPSTHSLVMINLPHLSSYTHQCLKEGEYDNSFVKLITVLLQLLKPFPSKVAMVR